MPPTLLFPLPERLDITSISETPEELLVRVTSHRAMSLYPLCSTPSSAVRNYYRRHPLDLPCAGRPVRLLLTPQGRFFRAKLSYLCVPKLLAVLETLCETYQGEVLSRELFLPSGGLMEVNTHSCWYNDVSLLVEQRRHASSRDDAESIQASCSYIPDERLEDL